MGAGFGVAGESGTGSRLFGIMGVECRVWAAGCRLQDLRCRV